MLNPAAYRLLSTPAHVSPECAQFFLSLLGLTDLRKFRAINPADFTLPYQRSERQVTFYLRKLEWIGILECGPGVRRLHPRQAPVFTWRVRPKWWMSIEDIAESREIEGRDELALPYPDAPFTLPFPFPSPLPFPSLNEAEDAEEAEEAEEARIEQEESAAPDAIPHNADIDRESNRDRQPPALPQALLAAMDDGASPGSLDKNSSRSSR